LFVASGVNRTDRFGTPIATNHDDARMASVRLSRVEQFLPSLATREELHPAIQAAIEPLATREELRAAIAPVSTREEVTEEGARSRRYIDVLIDDLRDDNRIILEHLVALSARVDALAQR
jgi:hypothetical protein